MSCVKLRHFINDTEIFEPVGFDRASINIEQKETGFARDVYYLDENFELTFYKNTFTGDLSHGYDIIEQGLDSLGYDCEFKYSIMNNGNIYVIGRFDLENSETDGKTYYKVKFIDVGGRFKFKKNFETKKTITSTPIKVLAKAKPVEQVSIWKSLQPIIIQTFRQNNTVVGITNQIGNTVTGNNAIQQEKYGIKNSVIPFETTKFAQFRSDRNGVLRYVPDLDNFKYVIADSSLSNTTINISNIQGNYEVLNAYQSQFYANVYSNIVAAFKIVCLVSDGETETNNPFDYYVLWQNVLTINGTTNSYASGVLPTNVNITLPNISQGQYIHLYFIPEVTANYNPVPNSSEAVFAKINLNTCDINIIATSQAINSVIEAHRWIDLMQETSNLPVNAPLFDIGGQFYNTVLTNGYGIRSIRGKDFITNAKDVYDIDFLCADFQVNQQSIEVGSFEEFYPDTQMAEIPQLYSENITISPNNRFRISNIKFGYNKFEQDRDEENTLDSVHTYSEWKAPNGLTQGKFERMCNIIFDVYKIESARRLGFEDRTKNTSLSEDDDLYGMTIAGIGNENVQSYKGTFAQLTSGNTLQLLTNSFNWYSTGIEAGDTITLTGSNAGNYIVASINNIGNILFLNGTNNGQSIEEVLTITYTLTGVLYKTKTSEGFTSITGVSNPSNFGNLDFQQKRILNRWNRYFATVTKYYPNNEITQTYFKSNKNLNVDGVQDSTPILKESLVLNESIAKIETKCSFDKAMAIANNLMNRNTSGTIGGYIVVDNVLGYIKDFEYILSTAILNLTVEFKESEYLLLS